MSSLFFNWSSNSSSKFENSTLVEVPDSCPDLKGRATSGFRPKLHSRAESLSLEILDISRAVGRACLNIPKIGRLSLEMGRESLDIPKFGRESLDMGRESLDIPYKTPSGMKEKIICDICFWIGFALLKAYEQLCLSGMCQRGCSNQVLSNSILVSNCQQWPRS